MGRGFNKARGTIARLSVRTGGFNGVPAHFDEAEDMRKPPRSHFSAGRRSNSCCLKYITFLYTKQPNVPAEHDMFPIETPQGTGLEYLAVNLNGSISPISSTSVLKFWIDSGTLAALGTEDNESFSTTYTLTQGSPVV